jgi:two-component system LytT family response regulator
VQKGLEWSFSAYDEYAIRAFEVNALDNLLKPSSQARLEKAIHRVCEATSKAPEFASRLRPLLESLAAQGECLTRLAVHDCNRIRVLDVGDVDWIGVENEQVTAHAGDRTCPIRRTLADLETWLDPAKFSRAHRSAIVNLGGQVQEVIPWFKGSHKLRLTSGAEVDLNRAHACTLRKILGW